MARERELVRLNGFLDKALAGAGRVAFVVGEAGSGKTVLLDEFARCRWLLMQDYWPPPAAATR